MFWAFCIVAILLLAYFISAMACGWGWEKCGKKNENSSNSNDSNQEKFLGQISDSRPDRLLY